MNIKELTNEELIQLFKDNSMSMQAIEHKYSLGKNSVGRLFTKRGINFRKIKEEEVLRIRKEYEENPKCCKYCGKPIPFEERNRKEFCNQSCSASYNNIRRNGNTERKSPDPNKKYYCLSCGKELKYSSSSNMKFCNQKCMNDYKYKQYIESWKEGKEDGRAGLYDISNYIRRYFFEKYNSSCQICGWNKINPHTGKVPLQLHHIDGDCLNNKEENLQLLCPNCHSLTENFGSSNKNSSRIYRKQKGNLEERYIIEKEENLCDTD